MTIPNYASKAAAYRNSMNYPLDAYPLSVVANIVKDDYPTYPTKVNNNEDFFMNFVGLPIVNQNTIIYDFYGISY